MYINHTLNQTNQQTKQSVLIASKLLVHKRHICVYTHTKHIIRMHMYICVSGVSHTRNYTQIFVLLIRYFLFHIRMKCCSLSTISNCKYGTVRACVCLSVRVCVLICCKLLFQIVLVQSCCLFLYNQ